MIYAYENRYISDKINYKKFISQELIKYELYYIEQQIIYYSNLGYYGFDHIILKILDINKIIKKLKKYKYNVKFKNCEAELNLKDFYILNISWY